MWELEERIVLEGVVIGHQILKVDSFLNHQIDPAFIMKLGEELADKFKDVGVTRVLTVEASGIAVAMAAGLKLGVPVVFAKKKQAATQEGDVYCADVFSYTRQESTEIAVAKRFLEATDVILIIDDFLAHGEALQGLVDIVRQSGAALAGAGIVVEKRFQHGGDRLRKAGVRIESLASIEAMEQGKIVFSKEEPE